MAKQKLFENACEELGLIENNYNNDSFWMETTDGRLVIDTWWSVEKGQFLVNKNIYDLYTRKQLEQIIKNLPSTIEFINYITDEALEDLGSEYDKALKEFLYKDV